MIQQNVFTGGVISDLDYSYIKGNDMVFPTHNIRITNKRGQGFVITSLDGNEKICEITNGFIPIAGTEHRDKVYLVSVNPTTHETELGYIWREEILETPPPDGGDDPTLDATDTYIHKFQYHYNYLNNYNDSSVGPGGGGGSPTMSASGTTAFRNPFRTVLFGYTLESNVKIIADDAFDESVNLYLCDGEHLDKVVNTGIKADGTSNGVAYNSDDFNGKLNHIPFSLKHPVISSINVDRGGMLKPGQYHIFFSYMTYNFDRTEYLGEGFPIDIFNGSSSIDVYGEIEKEKNNKQNETQKKLTIIIEGLDERYKYLSLGILRFSSNTNEDIVVDEYIISQPYKIQDNAMSITIYGNEKKEVLDSGTLYRRYVKERISTDHIFLYSYMLKSNLKRNSYDKETLSDLAKLITVSSYRMGDITIKTYDDIENNGDTELMTYQNANNLYDKVGLFAGEIYPYAIKFVLTDGTETESFPVTGLNEKTGATNNKGLLYVDEAYSIEEIIGAKFDMTNFKSAISSYDNIAGFYIQRGERISNMLYAGILERTANGVRVMKTRRHEHSSTNLAGLKYEQKEDKWFIGDTEEEAYNIPVFKYWHEYDSRDYPRRIGNYYSFPIAVYDSNNKNGVDAKGITSFTVEDGEQDKYEYSIAVPNVPLGNSLIDPEYDYYDPSEPYSHDVDETAEDSMSTKLYISDNKFALFSPDFMVEESHKTDNGGNYYLRVEKEFNNYEYSEGTPEHGYDTYIPSRTRVFEFGKDNGTYIQEGDSSIVSKYVVVQNSGCGIPLTDYSFCEDVSDDLPEWNIYQEYLSVDDYNSSDPCNIWYIDYINPQGPFVKFTSGGVTNYYVCIYSPNIGITPGSNPSVWVQVDSVGLYKQERLSFSHTGFTYDASLGLWVKGGCSSSHYSSTNPFVRHTGEVYDVKVYNIDKGTYRGAGKFSSYAEDGKNYPYSGKKGLFSAKGQMIHSDGPFGTSTKILRCDLEHYNRSYQTPAYLGIEAELPYGDNDVYMQTWYVKLYKYDPNTNNFYNATLNSFNVSLTQYGNISGMIRENDIDPFVYIGKGDNFKSKLWFRMAHHVDYDDNSDDNKVTTSFCPWGYSGLVFKEQCGDTFKTSHLCDAQYQHGVLYGFVCDVAKNVSLRGLSNGFTKDNDLLIYKFFPYAHSLEWIYKSMLLEDVVESFLLNNGYNQSLGYLKTLGYDETLPEDSLHYSTRMIISDKKIQQSYQNGYRMLWNDAYRDFGTEQGDIMRIFELYGKLVSINEKGIFYYDLGFNKEQGHVEISEIDSLAGYYGVQDWSAAIKTNDYVYGLDMENHHIFRVMSSITDLGKRIPKIDILDVRLGFEKELLEAINRMSLTGRTSAIVDNGISIGYNDYYGEVYFSFFNGNYRKTFVFAENYDKLRGTNDLHGALYIPYYKNVLMVPSGRVYAQDSIFGSDTNTGTPDFYFEEKESIVTFVANGNTEKDNSSSLSKIFEALTINSPHKLLDKIVYETELQKGEYVFTEGTTEFWKDAKWREGEWEVPITRETDNGNYYKEDSVMRGEWLKISLYFRGDREFYIKSVLSKFNISYK